MPIFTLASARAKPSRDIFGTQSHSGLSGRRPKGLVVAAPSRGSFVSATLVRKVLRNAGIPPAPQRGQLDWRSFLHQHAATALACDFLSVDTVLLRRLNVLVFICIGSRRIEYVACTSSPDRAWMVQQARNLLMDL